MAKQKVVIKVSMNGPKSRTKALQAVAGAPGVISAGLEGDDKSQVVVVGEGIDCITLVKLLQKKLKHVQIVTVTIMDEKEKEKDSKKNESKIVVVPSWPQHVVMATQNHMYEAPCGYQDPCCIM